MSEREEHRGDTFRARFDRNAYSVEPHLLGQHVLIRGNESRVRVFIGQEEVARHERCWGTNQDIEDPKHYRAAASLKSSAARGDLWVILGDLVQVVLDGRRPRTSVRMVRRASW